MHAHMPIWYLQLVTYSVSMYVQIHLGNKFFNMTAEKTSATSTALSSYNLCVHV